VSLESFTCHSQVIKFALHVVFAFVFIVYLYFFLYMSNMSKPPDDGFDIDNYADYASALQSEHPSSSDCEMESGNAENMWTPACRHNKRKACWSPLLHISNSDAVLNTVKRVPQSPKQITVLTNKKYICIISCQTEKLGKQNQIKVKKLLSKLVGTVKSINSTRACNLIVDCIDNQHYKKLLRTTHLVN